MKAMNMKAMVILLSFVQDPDLDYNLRADSADVILSLDLENKETGYV